MNASRQLNPIAPVRSDMVDINFITTYPLILWHYQKTFCKAVNPKTTYGCVF